MIILWIVIAILWTVLVFLTGWAFCKINIDQEAAKAAEDEPIWSSGVRGPAGPIGATGATGPPGEPGKDCPVSPDEIDTIKGRLTDLENRDHLYQDRFKRVEKKAGLNV